MFPNVIYFRESMMQHINPYIRCISILLSIYHSHSDETCVSNKSFNKLDLECCQDVPPKFVFLTQDSDQSMEMLVPFVHLQNLYWLCPFRVQGFTLMHPGMGQSLVSLHSRVVWSSLKKHLLHNCRNPLGLHHANHHVLPIQYVEYLSFLSWILTKGEQGCFYSIYWSLDLGVKMIKI